MYIYFDRDECSEKRKTEYKEILKTMCEMKTSKDSCLAFFDKHFDKIYAQATKKFDDEFCLQIGACPVPKPQKHCMYDTGNYLLNSI